MSVAKLERWLILLVTLTGGKAVVQWRHTKSFLICQGGDVRAASLPGQVTAAEHCKDISTIFYAAHNVTVMFRKHFLRLIWFTNISSIT